MFWLFGLLTQNQAATEKCGQVLKQSRESYQLLLAKYNALKRSCGNGKAAADGGVNAEVTDSYVVVLIDAHSHKVCDSDHIMVLYLTPTQFKDNLMHGAESGGVQAARLLQEAVAGHLANALPSLKGCRVVARAYANLKSLSLEVIDQNGGRNPHYKKPIFTRALGAFAAGFSNKDAFFDFVDVVDEQAVENKIVGTCSFQ